MRPGHKLKKFRRWFHSSFYTKASLDRFNLIRDREVRLLLCGLMRDSSDLSKHLHRYRLRSTAILSACAHSLPSFASSLMLEKICAHTVVSDDDEYLYYAEAAVKGTTQVASPGSAFVDFLPFSERRSHRCLDDIPDRGIHKMFVICDSATPSDVVAWCGFQAGRSDRTRSCSACVQRVLHARTEQDGA